MNEQLERQQSWNRAIIAMAYAPAFFVTPLLLAELIYDYAGLNAAGQRAALNIGLVAVILLFCGAMFMAFATLYAITHFFRKPRLSLGQPIPQRTLWALVAIASTLVNFLGLLNQRLQRENFITSMGIDVLSNTLIYGSMAFYLFALIKVIKEKRKVV